MARCTPLVLLALAACGGEPPTRPPATYVDPATCRSCHLPVFKAWLGSDHQRAMQVATESSVLADFSDSTFEKDGVTTRFFREGDGFRVSTEGADGRTHTYEVPYTFGVYPLQQYLLDVGGGRLQAFSVCWDVEQKRWFHLYDEPIRPDDPLHWTGPYQNWNYMCAECHVTGWEKGYDLASNTFRSSWHELGVGCQTCHGPGSDHVAWAERRKDTNAPVREGEPKGLVVDLKAKDAAVQVETCARCHARRDIVHAPYEVGRPFLDDYAPELLVAPLYFADGQILDEVYVYGSFLQSKKHARGVRCTDCHDPHTAKVKLPGNDLCAQCHQPKPPERFPILVERAKIYDDPTHHHHAPQTPGSACVDCHMPSTTYMQVDPRRDHGFRIPRPDLTEALGVPNACTGCHEDEGAAWAAERILAWFPESARARVAEPDAAHTFARARRGEVAAAPDLAALARDTSRPAIVRATALRELMRFEVPEVHRATLALLEDPEGLVRLAALDLVEVALPAGAPPEVLQARVGLVTPLLQDPLRAVRTEAARLLAPVARRGLPDRWQPAYARARAEFFARQEAIADRADAWLNRGVFHAAEGDLTSAEADYRTALRVNPAFIPVRFNLAVLLNQKGQNDEAERLLREVLQLMPEHGEAHYSLGLLLAEREQYPDAAMALSRAAALMPGRPRVHYNRALVLQHLRRSPEAEAALQLAAKLDPQSPQVAHALALLYLQQGKKDQARAEANRLAALVGRNATVLRLLEQIDAATR